MQKFSQYEIFAEQQVNSVFAIIFSPITGPKFSHFRRLVLPHGYKIFNLLFQACQTKFFAK